MILSDKCFLQYTRYLEYIHYIYISLQYTSYLECIVHTVHLYIYPCSTPVTWSSYSTSIYIYIYILSFTFPPIVNFLFEARINSTKSRLLTANRLERSNTMEMFDR